MRIAVFGFLALVLSACAAQGSREIRSGEIYQQFAAAEETHSVLYAFVRSWRRAGDGAIAVEFNRNRHYLFELEPRCSTDIPFARSVALVTSSDRRVDRFDRVRVDSQLCRIISIREIDYDALRAELARLKQTLDEASSSIETDLIHRDAYSVGT